jgi:CRISPR-associated protein Cmr3
MTTHCFIEPLDVLYLRGNRLFGDPGSHGESLVPPWPSVAAGALRSWLLAEDGVDFSDFAAGRVPHPALGTPLDPGPFRVTGFHLARELDGRIETLHAPPADLDVHLDGSRPVARRMQPVLPDARLATSSPLAALPVVAAHDRHKPASGWWLTRAGWTRHLRGQPVQAADWVASADLWAIDHRVGVGLDADRRRADDGKLFSMQAVALNDGLGARAIHGRVGFLASLVGTELPLHGMLRFGGDGRAAAVRQVALDPVEIDLAEVCAARRCRLVLTTPGLFADGWLPDGARANGGAVHFDLGGVRGRLVAAAVPRAEVVSGFDLAHWRPKPAERAAPAGSVYWLEGLEATPDTLRKLAENGLWAASGHNASRRAEGFNQIAIATY